ncbi:MAG: NAD(P)-dependent oxidoreductase [Deltaproteobacteria bacterium]|nr:NAD(P)-dependent oxidoreductase [Deltaproteobacteria bacterium]MBW2053521.1 NAD(P)-dependent oxidoreductase [Deltaproteobacteria bacterium]MBW2142128.1 NAD(P)-dependent oxidoreductase [Deltaproteobacteria bacterium]MBW2323885.1 NAD(P)-dependent oxidoreductase [Deltaproteobacteria bacterium]
MTLQTVGLLSPGNMGHTVGGVLVSNGLRVITCLEDRSERTRSLAGQAGIHDVPSYEALVRESQMILSILVPAQAERAAEKVAEELAKARADLVYVDCNAISPQTAREVGRIITEGDGRFVDASIIGPPPVKEGLTRFYASGADVSIFEELNLYGLDVRSIGERIGAASALKMCYAALTKGLTALSTELLIAAKALGVSEDLRQELELSQSALFKRMEMGLPFMPERSRRWVGEMEEIAATFAHVGLTPRILEGAADIYRFVGQTELADQTPENRDPSLNLEKIISTLADSLGRLS